MLLIYIILTLISAILCIYSVHKKNIHKWIYISVVLLSILQFASIQQALYDGDKLSDFPISYWIGYFLSSILSVILSTIAVFKKNNKVDN